MNQTSPALTDKPAPVLAERLKSLDAYRGLIMISLAFGGFGLAKTAGNMLSQNPDSSLWAEIARQFSHVQWTGCTYWDLIQPSFMFMVGLSLPYSYARRQERGSSYFAMMSHAVFRAIILIALGIFLTSNWSSSTNWSLMNVLCQIGLGYPILFLFWRKSWATHWAAIGIILLATWTLYETHPGAGLDTDVGNPSVGVSADWAQENLTAIDPSWHKNANFGHALDRWLLNLFNPYLPRKETFVFNAGGYQTINFLPSVVTMLFGLMAAERLRSKHSAWSNIGTLLLWGTIGILWGYALDQLSISPMIKRLWSPSWVMFSGGCCALILLFFYVTIDIFRLSWLALPLIVVGMNSIVMYVMGMLLRPWVAKSVQIHAGDDIFQSFGAAWQPTVQAMVVGSIFWLICVYLYRHRMFIRI